jgi:hypothetical protein
MPMVVINAGKDAGTVNPAVILALDFSQGATVDQSSYARGAPVTVPGQASPTYSNGEMVCANSATGGPGDPCVQVGFGLADLFSFASPAITLEWRGRYIVRPAVGSITEVTRLDRNEVRLHTICQVTGDSEVALSNGSSNNSSGDELWKGTDQHIAMVIMADGNTRLYADGVLAASGAYATIDDNVNWYVNFGVKALGNAKADVRYSWIYMIQAEKYTGTDDVNQNFTPPVGMPSIYL